MLAYRTSLALKKTQLEALKMFQESEREKREREKKDGTEFFLSACVASTTTTIIERASSVSA